MSDRQPLTPGQQAEAAAQAAADKAAAAVADPAAGLYSWPEAASGRSGLATGPHRGHEYEVVVCHGNVIRYFTCRALQVGRGLQLHPYGEPLLQL